MTFSTDGSKVMYGSEGSGSSVVAREVPGGGSGSGGSGSSSSDGNGSGTTQADGDGTSSTFKVGALAVGGAVVVMWGFKRLRRRPS